MKRRPRTPRGREKPDSLPCHKSKAGAAAAQLKAKNSGNRRYMAYKGLAWLWTQRAITFTSLPNQIRHVAASQIKGGLYSILGAKYHVFNLRTSYVFILILSYVSIFSICYA